ncbi:MAG TPA: ureidoglycolate lyase [Hyphomicrobiales bacterium]|nr:ureidoglycolate lyase [Hyphomicrobiales bacterium]
MPRIFKPRPLTQEEFASFGEVIQEAGARSYAINGGTTLRVHDLCSVRMKNRGRPLISFFRTLKTVALPLKLALLECHPLGSQAFIPKEFAPFIIAVAPQAPEPNLDHLQVFLTDGVQGVNYAPGVWHLPLASLTLAAYVVVDRGGPGENLREFDLTGEDILITE